MCLEEAGQGRRESHILIPQNLLTPAKSTQAEKTNPLPSDVFPTAKPFALSLQEAFDELPRGKLDLRLPASSSREARRVAVQETQAPVQTKRELVDELLQDLESL